ncbi:acyl-CoA dehydrogenase family protein [Streptomyces sp. NPDC055078]
MTPIDPAEFRARVRNFLHQEVPSVLDGVTGFNARAVAYRRALFGAGLAGLTVPPAYGGQGLPESYEQIFAEEARAAIPPEDGLFMLGVGILVPTLATLGSERLGAEYGPKILSGEKISCQMFSEPEAGSDLFGLRTRAVPDEQGGWRVTGQKVWTSFAHCADIGLLIARTDPDLPKQEGLSAFLIDMDAPGVEVRPLRQMTGDCEFNEVFFDSLHVPADRMIGRPGDGRKVVMAMLGHERAAVSRPGAGAPRRPLPVAELTARARRAGRADDPAVQRELLDAWLGERTATLVSDRIGDISGSGASPGPVSSLAKLLRTENGLRNARIAADLAFSGGAVWEDGDDTEYLAFQILDAPGLGFGGGTDEIQRNTIGERILGLPREPSVERGIPFSQLPTPRPEETP